MPRQCHPKPNDENLSMDPHKLGWPLVVSGDQGQHQGRMPGLDIHSQESRSFSDTSALPSAPPVTAIPREQWQCQYLDEVGVEPSHEDALDQLLLLAVLVTHGRGHGTVRRGRHQERFVEVLRELLDKAWKEETAPGVRFTHSLPPWNESPQQGGQGQETCPGPNPVVQAQPSPLVPCPWLCSTAQGQGGAGWLRTHR